MFETCTLIIRNTVIISIVLLIINVLDSVRW